MYNIAIILGAGNSTRMHTGTSKMLTDLNGKTVIERSVAAFMQLDFIDEIILACRNNEMEQFKKMFADSSIQIVEGGKSRTESVYKAVATIKSCDYVFIHDGARPLIETKDINTVYTAAQKYGGAALGTPVSDTIKLVDENLKITETLPREKLYAVQTPQVFRFNDFKSAIFDAVLNGLEFTDDCAIFEHHGNSCYIVEGNKENIKITTPFDVITAREILETRDQL